MVTRYLQGSKAKWSYAIETTPYEKQADATNYFGYITEDIESPGGRNPQTPLSSMGTRRGPHVNSADERSYDWTIPVVVYDENVPFEIALGSKSTGTPTIWTESDQLTTMTVKHAQDDLSFQEWFAGAKGSLSISFAMEEMLTAEFDCMSAIHSDTATGGDSFSEDDLDIPNAKEPFRFTHLGSVTYDSTEIATVTSGDLTWDNGLESQWHGSGRDPYVINETTGAEKYDMTLSINVTDTALFQKAVSNDEGVDVIITFDRAGDETDGCRITLNTATIAEATIPSPAEGIVETDISLMPLDTKIEMGDLT